MAIYLKRPHLDEHFPFRTLLSKGDILTTPHWHKEQEIIYVKKGMIRMGIGEEALEVKKGEFVLVAGGSVHYVLASPGTIRYVYQFNEKFFYELMQDKYELESIWNLWRDYPAHSGAWGMDTASSTRVLLDAIYDEDQKRRYAYTFALKGYMCLMILGLYRNKDVSRNKELYRNKDVSRNKELYRNKDICKIEGEDCAQSSQTLEKLDLVLRYVEQHYTQQITLKDVAGHIGLSIINFTKFFVKNVGKTFVQFLKEYRMENAKWILLNEDVRVVELIERIGIGSTKTYYRLFKEIVGMTPREYKGINCKDQ